ncbi:MAG: sigma-70 family RNA polymerase sigma factor [Acidobacteria bacterium]|nr:MAG: sigma-70 family RNA polymerase sigma factor [Acidobacteriota bacterium]
MRGDPPREVTQLLQAWRGGDQTALDRLIPLIHAELHRLAHHYMLRERLGHTLQTTALVNEAYLRLIDASQVAWQNRAHFLAISANLMRRILVDFARTRGYQKRGGNVVKVELDEARVPSSGRGAEVIALDDALKALAVFDERGAKVVELRFFGGLSEEETGEVLGVSARTVKRDWAAAKAWLQREMKGEEGA